MNRLYENKVHNQPYPILQHNLAPLSLSDSPSLLGGGNSTNYQQLSHG